jgi:mRNA-degrading endonuclease RelE of RelBE toxin-antitoxin system
MFRQVGFTIFLNFGTESMSNDESSITIQFTDVFKRQVRDLAKRYRKIKLDIQPIFEKLKNGELIGEQIQKTSYTVFKVRVKNSDIQKGKSGGYRVIYYVNSSTNILCILIYSKSEKDNVTTTEIKKVIQEFYDEQLQ